MLLADWLSQEGLTQRAAAARVGTAPNVFHRYVSGARIPAPAAIRQIYAMTGGAVTANDFHGLPAPQPWIVALARPEQRDAFARLGWQPWPDPEAAASGLMRRKARPEDGWQEVLAELAYLSGPLELAVPLDAGALVAPGIDPN